MASWQAGRFITDWADPSEVEKLLALMPVHAVGDLSAHEQIERRVALYNAFGIGAVAVDGGIEYQPGVEIRDQPLLAALDSLFERRYSSTARSD